MLTVGSLFAGIGGFDLGLERAGMRVIWQSEIDPYASAVLRKHWPDVPNHGDIRTIRAGTVERPDVLCGGFPCQDISNAGKRAGIDGERSGLWSEYARVIGEVRPRYVIVENVAALLGRGLERVLGDLAALGFDAEWHCIPASAVGAPHRRDRLWIVACANSRRQQERRECDCREEQSELETSQRNDACRCHSHVADANEPRLEGRLRESLRECASERAIGASDTSVCNTISVNDDVGGSSAGEIQWRRRETTEKSSEGGGNWWVAEPDVGRVANGVRSRVDRLRCLGNAIVPQVAEIIGRAIVSAASPTGGER